MLSSLTNCKYNVLYEHIFGGISYVDNEPMNPNVELILTWHDNNIHKIFKSIFS